MNELLIHIEKSLSHNLPAKKAHRQMAPYRDVNYNQNHVLNAKKSGVLILLYAKSKQPHVVLIKRSTYKGTHSGQISFPGGKEEEGDKNLIHTAVRETYEEIGVEHIQILGNLTEVYIPVSNFLVKPVVGVTQNPVFNINKREVNDVVEIPLNQLVNDYILNTTKVELSTGLKIKVPAFVYQKHVIWGATSMILNEFRLIVKEFNGLV